MVVISAKTEGVCWFPIDADGNAGMRRVKLARNYKGVMGGGGGGGYGKFWGGAAIFWAPI